MPPASLGGRSSLGLIYFAGVAVVAAVLVYEHRIVRPNDLSRVSRAFFTLNGWVSMILCLATVGDLFL